MSITAADYIKANFKESAVSANGILCARYFVVSDHYKSEAFINQNLINVVLKGEKQLHVKSGDIIVRAGEAYFLAKGEYVMSDMNEHFTQSWNLEEFAKRSGRSLSAFKGEFAKLFGATPMEWLWQKRLEMAKLLIDKGGLDIGTATHRCGFKSHSHFTRMFKQSFGHAPKKTSQAKN